MQSLCATIYLSLAFTGNPFSLTGMWHRHTHTHTHTRVRKHTLSYNYISCGGFWFTAGQMWHQTQFLWLVHGVFILTVTSNRPEMLLVIQSWLRADPIIKYIWFIKIEIESTYCLKHCGLKKWKKNSSYKPILTSLSLCFWEILRFSA